MRTCTRACYVMQLRARAVIFSAGVHEHGDDGLLKGGRLYF